MALCLFIITVSTLSAQELTPYWTERIKLTGETFVSMIEVEPQLANATLMAFALYEEKMEKWTSCKHYILERKSWQQSA